VNLFRFIPGYEAAIYQENKEPLLFLFLAFLITFALVRFYTRMARKRGWGSGNVGGVHVHHVVVGVVLMGIAGVIAYTQFSYSEIIYSVSAIIFGIGLALTLDEFAMIFHLKDVYWTEEGRTSIDALLLAAAGAGLLLVWSSPFTTEGTKKPGANVAFDIHIGDRDIKVGVWIALLLGFVFAIVVFLKKKRVIGVLGLGLFPIAILGALRLAKPDSPWARWFYDPDRGRERLREWRTRQRDRSIARFTDGRLGRFERWFSDLLGGAPTVAAEDKPGE